VTSTATGKDRDRDADSSESSSSPRPAARSDRRWRKFGGLGRYFGKPKEKSAGVEKLAELASASLLEAESDPRPVPIGSLLGTEGHSGGSPANSILSQQQLTPAQLSNIMASGTHGVLQQAGRVPGPTTGRSELDAKVVRECIRELEGGSMFYSINFDLTTRLQKKDSILEQNAARFRESSASSSPSSSPDGPNEQQDGNDSESSGKSERHRRTFVDVLQEPEENLPLWKRTDRRFWWNNWLSRPFIDAGVCLFSSCVFILQRDR
jgi:hypothetical protein